MAAHWDVSYEHEGETRHTSFVGKPKPISDNTTGKIKGYKGTSPFGGEKEVIAHEPYPEFHFTRIGRAPLFTKGQQLTLERSRTVLREVHDVTWRDGEWHYWVMPVDLSSTAASEWLTEKELTRSKLAN